MLKRIAFERFRGFKDFVADVAPVTAFLGPNSSGKTTALQAVRLACDALWLALDDKVPSRLERDGDTDVVFVTRGAPLVDHTRLLPVTEWRALFLDQAVGEHVAVRIRLEFEATDAIEELRVAIICTSSEQLELDVSVRSALAVVMANGIALGKAALIHQRLVAFLRERAPVAVFVPPFYGTVLAEELRTRGVIDHLLGSGDQSHVVRNMVVSLDTLRFERLNEFLTETMGVKLVERTSGDALQTVLALHVAFRDSNGDIELSAAGAGLINLVALYAALARWRSEAEKRPVIFLLDEPEAHLSPRLQAETSSRLARLVTDEYRAQLLLATHSVDILNRLSQDGALLLRCDRTATPSVQALDSDASLFNDLATWVDLTPHTAINFLAARRVLFVEGKDEVTILPRLGELRFRNDPLKLRRFRRWAIVQLEGSANAPIAGLLSRLVRNDVVRASAQQGGFDIIVTLDRDYDREPGTTTDTVDGIRQTTTVWPVHSLESLLVTVPILIRWLKALLGERTPADIEDRVRTAVEAADREVGLNNDAIARLTAGMVATQVRRGAAIAADHARPIRDISAEAQRRVQADPAAWQHGKARALHILDRVREGLDADLRGHFPTEVVRLIERANVNHMGDSIAPVPPDINTLFERMAAP